MIDRRRALMGVQNEDLPTFYEKMDWISCPEHASAESLQYIPTNLTRVELEVKTIDWNHRSAFGASTDNSYSGIVIGIETYSGYYCYIILGGMRKYGNYGGKAKYIFDVPNRFVKRNDTVLQLSDEQIFDFTDFTKPLCIFGSYPRQLTNATTFYGPIQIFENDIITANFELIRNKETGNYGVYDTIRKIEITNQKYMGGKTT